MHSASAASSSPFLTHTHARGPLRAGPVAEVMVLRERQPPLPRPPLPRPPPALLKAPPPPCQQELPVLPAYLCHRYAKAPVVPAHASNPRVKTAQLSGAATSAVLQQGDLDVNGLCNPVVGVEGGRGGGGRDTDGTNSNWLRVSFVS